MHIPLPPEKRLVYYELCLSKGVKPRAPEISRGIHPSCNFTVAIWDFRDIWSFLFFFFHVRNEKEWALKKSDRTWKKTRIERSICTWPVLLLFLNQRGRKTQLLDRNDRLTPDIHWHLSDSTSEPSFMITCTISTPCLTLCEHFKTSSTWEQSAQHTLVIVPKSPPMLLKEWGKYLQQDM